MWSNISTTNSETTTRTTSQELGWKRVLLSYPKLSSEMLLSYVASRRTNWSNFENLCLLIWKLRSDDRGLVSKMRNFKKVFGHNHCWRNMIFKVWKWNLERLLIKKAGNKTDICWKLWYSNCFVWWKCRKELQIIFK